MSSPSDDLANTYPSVELAYPFAVSAYDLAQKRLDAMESRLQTLIGFAATATLGIVTAASNKGHNFNSRWFLAAMVVCAVGIAAATRARLVGELKVLNPQTFYEEWLGFSEWEFKKNLVYFSGEAFVENIALVNRKGRVAVFSAIMFFLEAALLAEVGA